MLFNSYIFIFLPIVTSLPFLSGSESEATALAAGIRSTEYGYTKICTTKKGVKIPLVKGLEGS